MKSKNNIIVKKDIDKNKEIELIFYRLIFVGDGRVGKTQIINVYNRKSYKDKYESTLGADFQIRPITINNRKMNIYCIDTEGGCNFVENTGKPLVRKADALILVYDITILNTLNDLEKYNDMFENVINIEKEDDKSYSKEGNNIKYIVGNKFDLRANREVLEQTGKEMASKLKAKFMEVSAKNGLNVDKLFDNVIKDIIKRDENISSRGSSSVTRNNRILHNSNTLKSSASSGLNRNGTLTENESGLNYETSSYFLKTKNSIVNNNDYINNINQFQDNRNNLNFKNSIYDDYNNNKQRKCTIF
jgi:small GTP-binding protein